jgi:hypothetical protein
MSKCFSILAVMIAGFTGNLALIESWVHAIVLSGMKRGKSTSFYYCYYFFIHRLDVCQGTNG